MKVFLSWSGPRSHRVALVLREWLPSVIQEIVPYVSSEDIDKGARWSTDIAQELSDSAFGILCVTRENAAEPWLMFEAGALSKTIDKTFVIPFLFDIKRSEVDGPILQFQSTIFNKEDLQKLIITINKACERDPLEPDRLEKTFAVWYPKLQAALDEIHSAAPEPSADATVKLQSPKAQEILEEILELARMNQKLMRNPEGTLVANLDEMRRMLLSLLDRTERTEHPIADRSLSRYRQGMLEDMMRSRVFETEGYLGIRVALGLVRDGHPWIYDVGMETIGVLRSRKGLPEKHRAIDKFGQVAEFVASHPMTRRTFGDGKKLYDYSRTIQEMMIHTLAQSTTRR